MTSRKPEHQWRDEILDKYEPGVRIFLIVVAAAIFGLILWLGYMMFL